MSLENEITDAKKEYEKALFIARQERSEMIGKIAAAIEATIYTFYGFKKGSVVNIDTVIGRSYAIQYFDISASNILANDNTQGIVDRVRVILRETNDFGELIIDKIKHTVTCLISDIKLNSKINQ
jgi:hypothetical protein